MIIASRYYFEVHSACDSFVTDRYSNVWSVVLLSLSLNLSWKDYHNCLVRYSCLHNVSLVWIWSSFVLFTDKSLDTSPKGVKREVGVDGTAFMHLNAFSKECWSCVVVKGWNACRKVYLTADGLPQTQFPPRLLNLTIAICYFDDYQSVKERNNDDYDKSKHGL